MSQLNRLARWSIFCRWIAITAIGLTLAFCYTLYQPAFAQDKGADKAAQAPVGAESNGKSAAKSSGTGTLTQQEIDRKAEAALNEAEPSKKETQPATTSGARETLDILKDIKWLSPHMWAVYAILCVSIVAVTFALERCIGLRRSKVLPGDLVAGLRVLAARKGDFDLRHAMRLCKQYPSSAANVVRAMLAKVGRPVTEIEHAMSEAADREATRLYANVRWQTLAFNVAPMLGLAGTVHGIIIAFFVTAHMPLGSNKMESLATGIYAALVCTLAGLMVAIPSGILAHVFEGRIMKLFRELDDLTRSLLPHLERFEGHAHPKGHEDKSSSEHDSENDSPEDGHQSSRPATAPRQ